LAAERLKNLRVIIGKGKLEDNLANLQAKIFEGAYCADLDGPYGRSEATLNEMQRNRDMALTIGAVIVEFTCNNPLLGDYLVIYSKDNVTASYLTICEVEGILDVGKCPTIALQKY
jgi:hypothetical protein